MRSMVREPDVHDSGSINWKVLRKLSPYLLEYRTRVFVALALLVGAKLAGVGMPLLLKAIVDAMDPSVVGGSAVFNLVAVPVALLVGYGALRFFNVALAELRDTIFSRVTERAQRRVGLEVFSHLYNLDMDFHLSRRTGGLSRDIERGTRGINFILRFGLFNIVPTLFEVALVAVVLLVTYSWLYAAIALVSVILYVGFSVFATEWRTRFVREANLLDSRANTRAVDALLNYETVKYWQRSL